MSFQHRKDGALIERFSSLDLSFNNIRHPPSLPSFKKVNVLYLVQNKISRIEEGELDWCAETITSLELGGNRIRVSRSLARIGSPNPLCCARGTATRQTG
jgi:Leucine-rich repeat (LRR) protein